MCSVKLARPGIASPDDRRRGLPRSARRHAVAEPVALALELEVILIDRPMWPAHGTLWSHLVSDRSLAELHEFAASTGIRRRGFDRDHYDVPEERYADLIVAGAVAVTNRELVERLRSSGLRVTQRQRRGIH